MTTQELISLAKEYGFETTAPLNVATLTARDEVRDMCAANTCRAYGSNWSCPPACGTIAQCAEKMGKFTRGVLVQTIGELEDSWDFEGIQDAAQKHSARFREIALRLWKEDVTVLPLTAGACPICEQCAYPEPCRFPDKAISSMEAYGLLVNQVCTDNGVPYNYGSERIAYSGCLLLP